MLPCNTDAKVEDRRFNLFLKEPGPRNGVHTSASHVAYVHFGKLRIKHGKTMTTKRDEMEDAWKDWGMTRESSHNIWITLPLGEKAKIDRLGKLQIVESRSM